jgi:hypothetical protein
MCEIRERERERDLNNNPEGEALILGCMSAGLEREFLAIDQPA